MTNCDIQIWHTLAEVKIFVFLFVIKLFLNCCCSINVLYCFADFFFFCDLFFVYKNLYLLSCLTTGDELRDVGRKVRLASDSRSATYVLFFRVILWN